ncbi:crcB protein [Flavobacterium limnosediminis JC2902]|uniref:Fluoride-specific ion channel FluC n=1 Tax=Flavobacterium limnosediminis JC2902 TaxID=1341181 RepID=V6SPS7_9FLAO|nr:fluoride efflux transporter CrcB [Flavobacterium limnosediminis]ESU28459.1 crcB protein [Flavobacterium limnosediminis JC2902]
MRTILLIALGGGLGSVFRYLTSQFVNRFFQLYFPYATFITNVLGCFLIGLFLGWLEKNDVTHPDLKFFLVTGFCGGYTTFSTFSNENVQLFQANQSGTAFLYIGLSVVLGLAATWGGLMISKL